ncbi:MAG TPA: pyrimidine dimer DNA glycosylase/endonuclease V [Desulfuromonadaceae bacterium]|nr:pyrimidine dimer DNA glycosylase/endonuclease V [Desulfuromonadaceae bacterium]
MRLWTLHPRYLDAKGLVALWREALLAQKVLQGKTRGYRHHPQLIRFAKTKNPPGAIAAYLAAVHTEATARGYRFNKTKIGRKKSSIKLRETRGQLLYEWMHLRKKLKKRDPKRLRELDKIKIPRAHPSFRIVPGKTSDWEVVTPSRQSEA